MWPDKDLYLKMRRITPWKYPPFTIDLKKQNPQKDSWGEGGGSLGKILKVWNIFQEMALILELADIFVKFPWTRFLNQRYVSFLIL